MKVTKKNSRPSRIRRILALGGAILLVFMYLLTLFSAFIDSADTMIMFKITILTTVLVPVLLWAYGLVFRLVQSQTEEIRFQTEEDEDNEEADSQKKES